jgi:hypothetical protein
VLPKIFVAKVFVDQKERSAGARDGLDLWVLQSWDGDDTTEAGHIYFLLV